MEGQGDPGLAPAAPAVMRSPRAPCTSDMMHSSTAPADERRKKECALGVG